MYTGDDARGVEIARRLRAGVLTVNSMAGGGSHMPFGGYKESGLGREHGVQGFGEHLETKVMPIPH